MPGWGSGPAFAEAGEVAPGWGDSAVFPGPADPQAGWTGNKQPGVPPLTLELVMHAPTVSVGHVVVVLPGRAGAPLPETLPFPLGGLSGSMGVSLSMPAPVVGGMPVVVTVPPMLVGWEMPNPVAVLTPPEIAPGPMMLGLEMPTPVVSVAGVVRVPPMGGVPGLPYTLPFTLDERRTVLSMPAPTVSVGHVVKPPLMSVSLAAPGPVVSAGSRLPAPAMTMTMSPRSPVAASGGAFDAPPMELHLQAVIPAVSDGDTVSAPPMTVVLAMPSPAVSVLEAFSVNVPVMGALPPGLPYVLPFTLEDSALGPWRMLPPVVSAGHAVTASVMGVVFAAAAPTVTVGHVARPPAMASTVSAYVPTGRVGHTVLAGAMSMSADAVNPAKVTHDPVLLTITSSQTVTLPGWFRPSVDKVDVVPYGGGSGTKGSGIVPGNGGAGDPSSALGVTGNGGGSSSSTSMSNPSSTTYNSLVYAPGSSFARGGNPGSSGAGTVTPTSLSVPVTVGSGGSAGKGGAFGSSGSAGQSGVVYLYVYQA